jgi:L-ascorbate metabolism protein UlaG (beta-lactamase superfamily)
MAHLPDGVELTWLGHATFLLTTGSNRILIDPWVGSNPACPEGFDCRPVDTMLITHAHFDHIGDAVEMGRDTGAQIVSIVETSKWLASKGLENLVEMNKGGTVEVAGCRVHMTHALHSCGITDGDEIIYGGEAAGYVIELPGGYRIYHAGDTTVFSDMALIGKLLAPDLALLPIGDNYTMGPAFAAEAIRMLGVRKVVPMHFGTFPVLTGTPDELRKETSDIDGLEIVELEPGASLGGAKAA